MPPLISSKKQIEVRFSEVDSLRMVWHGNYLRYFEDGREDLGRQYGLDYLEVYANGFVTPLVKSELDYKRPLRYGDSARVETTFVNDPAAKLIFEYTIYNSRTEEVVCTGRTIQVFLNTAGELELNAPEFFLKWKKKMGF